MNNIIFILALIISTSSMASSQKRLSKYYQQISNSYSFNTTFKSCLTQTIQNLRKNRFPNYSYLQKYVTKLPIDLYDNSFFHYNNSNFQGYSPANIIGTMANSGWNNYNSNGTLTNIAGGTGLYMSVYPSNSANFGRSLFTVKFTNETKVFQAVDDVKRVTNYEYVPELKQDISKVINDLDLKSCNDNSGKTFIMNVFAKISQANIIKYTHKEMGWFVAINGYSTFHRRVDSNNFKQYSSELGERTRQANTDLYNKNPSAYLNLPENAKKVQIGSLSNEADLEFLFKYLYNRKSIDSFNFMFTPFNKWTTLRAYQKVSNKCSLGLNFEGHFKNTDEQSDKVINMLSCLYKKECEGLENQKCY